MSFHAVLYQQAVIRELLSLRETLVRHDENLKALALLDAAPYFVADHPVIVEARREQYAMVRHVLPKDRLEPEDRERDFYAEYYADNPGERPFEKQYGISVEQSHLIPRVEFLRQGLKGQLVWMAENGYGSGQPNCMPSPDDLSVLDAAGNDGWMAARLSLDGYRCALVDLHPGNIALARERGKKYRLGHIVRGSVEDSAAEWARGSFDAVACFELIEHVANPRALLGALVYHVRPGGRLYISTPSGAVESGNVPGWATVEPKGHVRVFTPDSLNVLLSDFGQVEELVEGQDGVLCARVRPG